MSKTQTRSVCPLDCPDTCSLDVTVEEGKVVKLDGSTLNPTTQGYICKKVRSFPELMYGDERLRQPAIRAGSKGEGEFREASWNEALELITTRLTQCREQFGSESILPFCYGGSNGFLTQDSVDARFFRRLGASQLARTVCAMPSSTAATGMYGKMSGVSFEDYVHANLIVVWGANPHATGIHLVPYITQARRRGAQLIVVDPRSTPLARQADLHIAPKPGTDLVVALSLINWLFENDRTDHAFLNAETTGAERLRATAMDWGFERAAEVSGVPVQQLDEMARSYSEANPAVIRCGWGVERNRNGGSAVAAILALPAIAGKFGVPGGGFTMSNSAAWKINNEPSINEPPITSRIINMNHLGRSLLEELDPPIKSLFVYNCNPVSTMPRQDLVMKGLQREDLFTVVFDQVMTDTASFADVLLPATTFLEHHELRRSYGSLALLESEAVVTPVGESRCNNAVFRELCERMGMTNSSDPETDKLIVEAIISQSELNSTERSNLGESGYCEPPCGTHPVQFVDVHPETSDGKVHLFSESLDEECYQGLYSFDSADSDKYPLSLISPASAFTVSSTFGHMENSIAKVMINTLDAAERSISNGDVIRIFNQFGAVVCHADVTERIRSGVVSLPKGLWARHTMNGMTSNALSPDSLADLGGGACFNDARVEIQLEAEAAR